MSGGVLKSSAVTKNVQVSRSVKRYAVKVSRDIWWCFEEFGSD